MVIRILTIFTLLCFGCTATDNISEFEKVIGAKYTKVLDSMVKDFEQSYLKRKYKNLSIERGYERFLQDMKEGNLQERIMGSPKIISIVKDSGFYEELYSVIDTVWYDKSEGVFYLKERCLMKNGRYETSLSESFLIQHDSIEITSEINNLYQTKERNLGGIYWFALSNASKSLTFLKNYIEVIESMGDSPSYAMASGLLELDIKLDDYFLKRLIVTELVKY